MGMNSTSKDTSNGNDIMGIYFTPQDKHDTSLQLRNKTSRQKNKAKSRYDSDMYALPDLPDEDSKERSREHNVNFPPTVNEQNCLKQFWEWRGRTLTLATAGFVLICFCVGTPLYFVMVSGNKGNCLEMKVFFFV